MMKFFYIEGAYLILAAIILLITLFVSSRPFMPKGAVKKGLIGVGSFLALAIGAHYWVTTSRMESVRAAFLQDRAIICESRMIRQGAQSIVIRRSLGWRLVGDELVNEAYVRPYFLARCIVK